MFNIDKKDYCKARLDGDIKSCDEELFHILGLEDERQEQKLIMIASESECPLPIRNVLSCSFTNIYAEGYPSRRLLRETGENLPDLADQLSYLRRYSDRRYYKGVEYADVVEALCCRRAAGLFANDRVKACDIFANVQPLSGAAANNAVYEAFTEPGDTVMGLDLSYGGHLTHGSPANRSGRNYNIIPYHADIETGEIDFKEIEELASKNKPKMIIAGFSAFPRLIDWERFRDIAHSCGAFLLADISHIAGPIAAGCFPSPIGIADVVTFTTHKTMCGPRGAVILTSNEEYGDRVNSAVFPGEQGGPHLNSIAAKALLFRLASTDGFKAMQRQVLKNAKTLAETFVNAGGKLAYGGTDSHMVLLDLRGKKGPDGFNLRGEIASRVLDMCNITCNKNTIPGDTSAVHPGALRFGTTWITQRGFTEEHTRELGNAIMEVINSMVPYKYLEISGDTGRAKTPASVIEKTANKVKELIERAEERTLPETSAYPYWMHSKVTEIRNSSINHIDASMKESAGINVPASYPSYNKNAEIFIKDASDNGIIEIRGDRSQYFLDEVTTIRVSSMKEGENRCCWILSNDGKAIAMASIAKIGDKKCILSVVPSVKESVIKLLRGLADGYIMFDTEDIYAKIQGPCVVDDKTAPFFREEMLTSIEIVGKDISSFLKKAKINAEAGKVSSCEIDGKKYTASICSDNRHAFLFMHPDNAEHAWNLMKSLSAEPVGYEDMAEIKKSMGYSDPTSFTTAEEVYDAFKDSGMFEMGKPYFLGQKYLTKKYPVNNEKTEFTWEEKEEPIKRTCLYNKHVDMGARMAPFAGYSMPVWYTSINEEHKQMRKAAGLFDVSHMGVFSIEGPDACRFLDTVSTNYAPKLLAGQSQYGYMLDPDGKVLDDIMLYRRSEDKFMLVVNASNASKIKAWLNHLLSGNAIIDRECPIKEIKFRVEVRDLHDPSAGEDEKVDIALQGPASYCLISKLLSEEESKRFAKVKRNEFIETDIRGMKLIISRTGYTGESSGYELYLHPSDAIKIWDIILEEGKEYGVIPCGLGCRDSARTEAGLPLYGHELEGDYGINPLEAGYAPFVKFHKPFFIGRKAMIEAERKRKTEIARFRMIGKNIRIVKHGSVLATKRGDAMGYVTSSVIIDGIQYGLAYINKKYASAGTRAEVFILGGGKVNEKQKSDLKIGDKVSIPEEAVIMTRFPEKNEFDERYGREN